jgi:hypothetical protein
MSLQLGKRPATDDPRDLKFETYLDRPKLPPLPSVFGREGVFPASAWGMLGNDEWGDCAWAGPAHETMLWTKVAGRPVNFTTADVLSDYSAGTGFDPNAGPPGNNPTDQGSNVRDVLKYRQNTGIVDAHGNRHKVGAYVALEPGNWQHVMEALYLFGAIGIGIEFPSSAMDQFHQGQIWDVVEGARIEGGHYICGVGFEVNTMLVTWGKCIGMTKPFFEKYCDEAYAMISNEMLRSGKSPEGFSVEQLNADLQQLKKA